MVVKEDGTKWACASCLKGHRVSGCTHTERDLTFVPKKGRPVTQCNHCRSERKKRSAHNRCDCGDKLHTKDKCKEKCIHLRQAEAQAAAAAAAAAALNPDGVTTPPVNNTITDSIEPHAPASDLYQLPEEFPTEERHCCCPHGGKCTCSGVKQETPDKSVDMLPKASHPRPKPSLTSHRSEGHLTIFANGHHKPVHRNNNAAHESGVPYKLPRHHSNQGASIARRSVDSLASVKSASPPIWTQPAPTNAIAVNQEPSTMQSERNSPHSDYSVSYQPVFDASGMSMDATSYSVPDVSASVPNTTFQDFGYPSAASGLSINTTSTEPSMSVFSLPTSGVEAGQDYWSAFDWNKLDSNTFEAQPALTNASSGTISEIDDLPRMDDLSAFDAQYSIDGQAQVANLDFSTDYCNGNNNNYSSSLNMSGSFPNRWSMPTFSSQDNSATFLPLTADRPAKEMSGQTFGGGQSIQPTMSSGTTSTQSPPPATTASNGMFQNKGSELSNYNWDPLLPGYNTTASNDGMNDSLDFASSEPAQNVVMTGQSVQGFKNDGTSNYEGFDDSYGTMQWNEGVTIPAPADQDYLNTFNIDSNWNFTTFENSWS